MKRPEIDALYSAVLNNGSPQVSEEYDELMAYVEYLENQVEHCCTCGVCDEKKEVITMCFDCLKKMIKENNGQ